MITVAPTPWKDRRHTIFGEVVEGMDVATHISNLPRDVLDRPRTRVTLRSVTFRRVVPPAVPGVSHSPGRAPRGAPVTRAPHA